MPELPEVRTSAYYLNKKLQGITIKDITISCEKMIKETSKKDFQNFLKNRKIILIENIAKFLVFHFDNDIILLSHLRMEGKYRIDDFFKKQTHDHLIFKLNNNKYLFYNDTRQFGTFHIRNKDNYLKINPLAKLGREPSKHILEEIYQKIHRKKVAIKTILLDQTVVTGLGNIYANEVLWKTQTNPLTPSNKISKEKLKDILINSKKIMDKATKYGGTTIFSYLAFNTKKGNYQQFLEVHNKAGKKCSRCNNTIEKIKVNGRGTYFCPICQKKQN